MNHPDISHERAWARQGQMPRVLLGGAVRPVVATAHGADIDLQPQRPAAAPITEYHDEELDSAFLELEIRSAVFYLNRAMDAGKKPDARKWEQEQRRLIWLRSPEQIARMEAAIERAIKGAQ